MTEQDMERRLESVNWKQKLPIWGLYYADKDISEGRPSLLDTSDKRHNKRAFNYILYQSASMAILASIGIYATLYSIITST